MPASVLDGLLSAALNGGSAALKEGPAESTDREKEHLQVRDCTSNPTPGCPIIIIFYPR